MREKHPAQYTVSGHRLYVALLEDLDQYNVDRIRSRMDRLVEDCHITEIYFDFQKVGFMDSSGIGMILGRYRKMTLKKGKVFAIGIHPGIDRILRYSGLYQILMTRPEQG